MDIFVLPLVFNYLFSADRQTGEVVSNAYAFRFVFPAQAGIHGIGRVMTRGSPVL